MNVHYFWFPNGSIRYGQPRNGNPAPEVGVTRDIDVATRLISESACRVANMLKASVDWELHDNGWQMGSVVATGTSHPKDKEDQREPSVTTIMDEIYRQFEGFEIKGEAPTPKLLAGKVTYHFAKKGITISSTWVLSVVMGMLGSR